MKNVKLKLLLLLGCVTVYTSCTGDLEVEPKDDDLFLSENFFKSPGAYKQGLAGVYGNLVLTGNGPTTSNIKDIDAGFSQFARCLWNLQDLTTDEAMWTYNNDAGIPDLQTNTWTPNNAFIVGMHSRLFLQIALCNEYLRQTTSEKLSARGVSGQIINEVNEYRNEVRALKAYAYYYVMDLFGKGKFYSENDPVGTIGVNYDRAQLFNFVESELNAVLPNLKAPRSNEYGRVDKAFAWMVLAKIYLNAEVYIGQNKYDNCVTMCNNIIGGGYVLKPNYLDNFKADNHTSSEMIFTLQSDGVVSQNYGATTVMLNGSVGSIEQNGVSLGVSAGGWGGALRLRKEFSEKFQGAAFASDERNTIISAGRPIAITTIAQPAEGFVLAKYSNRTSTGVAGASNLFADTDFPLFRLADVYLMYAECAKRGAGNATMGQAVTYINSLRERANNSPAQNISAGDLTLDFLIDERARELHWEAHRRQDLVRFGKFAGGSYNWNWKGGTPSGISVNLSRNLFPIPVNQ